MNGFALADSQYCGSQCDKISRWKMIYVCGQVHEHKLNGGDKVQLQMPQAVTAESPNDRTEAYFQELVAILKNANRGTPVGGQQYSNNTPIDGDAASPEVLERLQQREKQVRELQGQLDSLRQQNFQASLVLNCAPPTNEDAFKTDLSKFLATTLDVTDDRIEVSFIEQRAAADGSGIVVHLALKGVLNEQDKQPEDLLHQLIALVDRSDSVLYERDVPTKGLMK